MNVNFAVTKNYSLTMVQIGKVADLSQRFGVSQGRVVREAIDRLFEAVECREATISPEVEDTMSTPANLPEAPKG